VDFIIYSYGLVEKYTITKARQTTSSKWGRGTLKISKFKGGGGIRPWLQLEEFPLSFFKGGG
jgi:hypothetical protein